MQHIYVIDTKSAEDEDEAKIVMMTGLNHRCKLGATTGEDQ